jgi:hypothetical protein
LLTLLATRVVVTGRKCSDNNAIYGKFATGVNYTDREFLCCPWSVCSTAACAASRRACSTVALLTLDVYFLQQHVMLLDVSVLHRPVLPLDVSVLQQPWEKETRQGK